MSKEIILEEEDGQTEFDVILVGTGIVESILSCALSRAGKKILHLDANRYYGANFASLNLKQYKSYIQGKLDELPSFRSHEKAKNNALTQEEIECIVNDSNVKYQPISFLNSITSQKNVFGNFDQSEPINDYRQKFKEFEESVLTNRYRKKYQIGHKFAMHDKNSLLAYEIVQILPSNDSNDIFYKCEKIQIGKNMNDGFPSMIYLTLSQLIHTQKFTEPPTRNFDIFGYDNSFYFKCNDDENCLCQCIEDETKQILFYEIENEIDCIIGNCFETKKILYKIIDIDSDKNILCNLVSQNRFYGQSKDEKAKEIIISFNMQQIVDFKWIKTKKRKQQKNGYQIKEEWDNDIDFKDEMEWNKLCHLRQVFKCFDKEYRKICIDFIPNLVYSIESLIEVLIRSKVSTYVDFRGINKNFIYRNNLQTIKVPLSRSDVFKTKDLTFLEKRQLTKFMQSVLNQENDEKENEMKFSEFMQQQNVSEKLEKFIRYALAFQDCPSEDLSAKEMLKRLRLFLKSIGRFSNGSFLFPLYGSGDLAPGFVRSSAVKGGVFILDWHPKGIIMQNIKFHKNFGQNGYAFCLKNVFFVILKQQNEKYECMNMTDQSIQMFECDNLRKMYEENEIFSLIERRFECGYLYEIESIIKNKSSNEMIIRCLLCPQISLNPNMHNVPKCVYVTLEQLKFVKWIDFENKINETNKSQNSMQCTGIITASNQFIKTRYFVGAADYFKDTIESVLVKHCRMTVISDGPIVGTKLLNTSKPTKQEKKSQDDKEDDDDSDDDDDDDESDESEEEKEEESEKSHCCVVHIPPNTQPFDNAYSIHMIQLDHYSLTVPPPLCLTFFWMQCGDDANKIKAAKESLERCYNIFYREQVIVEHDENEENRPLGLMRTIYEQRIRTVNTSKFANNVFIVNDLSDTIGYENAVQCAKSLFLSMFPNDEWMQRDKIIKPKETRADKVFSALAEEKEDKNEKKNDEQDANKETEKVQESTEKINDKKREEECIKDEVKTQQIS